MTRRTALELGSDALVLVAIASIGYGCWLYWPPLAFVVVGVLLLVVAVAVQLHASRRDGDDRE